MGICYWDAKQLWEARLRGAPFADTVTIGRQSLYLHPREVRTLCDAYRARYPAQNGTPLGGYEFGDYADEFLRTFLGVESLEVLDVSEYEGATILHDLNRPIPETLRGGFDAVIDGGSLEHVFNFPTAIANLMQLVRVGGSVFVSTPANNLCGHGFYQFSPEVMFRVFAPDNGFELRGVTLCEATFPSVELTAAARAYDVTDPKTLGRRVGIMSKGPVTMLVEATKVADVPPFGAFPQQSDYIALWRRPEVRTADGLLRRVFEALPRALRARVQGYREKRRFSFSNTSFYRRL